MMRSMFRRGAPADPFDAPDRPSARDEVLAALAPWVAAHRRPAWRPRVAPGEPAGARSTFGGRAWLAPGEAPPACGVCGRPLPLLLQLDLGALPAELAGRYGSGLLQLFACDQDACAAEGAWAAFSDVASLVRVVPASERSVAPSTAPAAGFPASAIVGWERFDDQPDPEDHELAGLTAAYDVDLRTVTLRCPEVGVQATVPLDDLEVDDIARAAEGDKLAGWPSWVQARDYPNCPTCGEAMRVVFQLASDDHLSFGFGDTGIGHVTQCPTHLRTVAFAWSAS